MPPTAGAAPSRAEPRVSWRMTARAWPGASRGLPWPTLAAVLCLAAAPTAIVLLDGGRDHRGALVAAALVGAAAAAFSVEDAAGETLSASPTSLARRRALRLSAITAAAVCTWAALVTLTLAFGSVSAAELGQRVAEVAAVSGVAGAIAGLAHRRGLPGAAPGGATLGALSVLVTSALAQRFHELPALMAADRHERWWLVAATAWAAVAWTWRDPAR